MLRLIFFCLTLMSMFVALGCVVETATPPPRCAGGVWVQGHYGRHGVWHHAHWRCPGVVEVVEVD